MDADIADIEAMLRKCVHCQLHSKSPPAAAPHPWEFPSQPWSRIHLDYAGPFQGHMFLVAVDSFSKWLEVAVVSSATSRNTIDKLREMFARHGIPETMVTDNGTPFTSSEFQTFVDRNGIRHCRSAPYHPASNGLAERAVQTLKHGLLAQKEGDLNTRLSRFLFQYRVTPHSMTGVAPSELLMKRRLRTHLDLVKPDISQKVRTKQFQALGSAKERRFVVGDMVLFRNWGSGPKWLPGKVVDFRGQVNLEIQTSQGLVHRHVDQVKRSQLDEDDYPPAQEKPTSAPTPDVPLENPDHQSPHQPPTPQRDPENLPRRSSRVSREPDRFQATWK